MRRRWRCRLAALEVRCRFSSVTEQATGFFPTSMAHHDHRRCAIMNGHHLPPEVFCKGLSDLCQRPTRTPSCTSRGERGPDLRHASLVAVGLDGPVVRFHGRVVIRSARAAWIRTVGGQPQPPTMAASRTPRTPGQLGTTDCRSRRRSSGYRRSCPADRTCLSRPSVRRWGRGRRIRWGPGPGSHCRRTGRVPSSR